jgi:uncharacterized protein (TIGR02145 family)
MKKAFLLFAMACFAFAGVLAQNGEIANLQVSQRTDGSGLVDIHFDLNGAGASYNLQFEASFDDGANYEPLSETFLTGELTDVLPGTGKHIIWAGKDSHPETFSTQTRARVIAIEYIPPTVPTVMTAEITGITSISATSGGNVTEDGGAPVTARGVVWSTSPNPTLEVNDGFTEDGEGLGEFVSDVIGSPNITYQVRAYAVNNEGISYGEIISFKMASVNPCPGMPTIIDVDGNTYNTVQIGNQCWMAENLKTTRYRNGVPIDYPGEDNVAWANNTTGAYSWYNHDTTMKQLYGALYNYYVNINYNAICPEGWRVPHYYFSNPNLQDFDNLANYISGGFEQGGKQLKSCRQVNSTLGDGCNTLQEPKWKEHENFFGIDYYGFSALPSGVRNTGVNPGFNQINEIFMVYNRVGFPGGMVNIAYIDFDTDFFNNGINFAVSGIGMPIRCIRENDNATVPSVTTFEVSDINQTTAKLSANAIHENSPLIARGFVWNLTPDATLEDNLGFISFTPYPDHNPLSTFSHTLIDLQPANTYFVRAFAVNAIGTTYGNVVSFVTLGHDWHCGDPLIDTRDGQSYATVQIGDQCWMAENLAYLPSVSPSSIGSNTTPYYYVYDYQGTNVSEAKLAENYSTYGVLYNWPASLISCPDGWHLPSDNEWKVIEGVVDSQYGIGNPVWDQTDWRGFDVGKNLKSNALWGASSGTDQFGFSALPAGYRSDGGTFNYVGYHARWYTSTQYSTTSAWNRTLLNQYDNCRRNFRIKSFGFSVRCIKNN